MSLNNYETLKRVQSEKLQRAEAEADTLRRQLAEAEGAGSWKGIETVGA